MAQQTNIIEISDLKKITRTIDKFYGLNLSNYALSSLKRRVETFITKNFSISVQNLIERLERQESFAESLIYCMLASDNEMFRDNQFWFELLNIINKEYRYNNLIDIWLPDTNNYNDIYSLLIILDRLKLIDKTDVYVSSASRMSVDKIFKAAISKKEMKQHIANFERFDENDNLENYFNSKDNSYTLRKELLKNVKLELRSLLESELPTKFDIILFRNKMIFYNESLQNRSLRKITSKLKFGAYLAIGAKEKISYPLWENDYFIYSKEEKIYRKQATALY